MRKLKIKDGYWPGWNWHTKERLWVYVRAISTSFCLSLSFWRPQRKKLHHHVNQRTGVLSSTVYILRAVRIVVPHANVVGHRTQYSYLSGGCIYTTVLPPETACRRGCPSALVSSLDCCTSLNSKILNILHVKSCFLLLLSLRCTVAVSPNRRLPYAHGSERSG